MARDRGALGGDISHALAGKQNRGRTTLVGASAIRNDPRLACARVARQYGREGTGFPHGGVTFLAMAPPLAHLWMHAGQRGRAIRTTRDPWTQRIAYQLAMGMPPLPGVTLMRRCLSVLALALGSAPVLAVDGLLDSSFGVFSTGRNFVALDIGGSNSDTLADVLVNPQGQIYLIGTAKGAGATSRYSITRLTPAGLIDESFGIDGTVLSSAAMNADARRARFDASGNIVIVGRRTFGGTDTDFNVCRHDQQGAAVPFSGPGTTCVVFAFDIEGGNLADVPNDFIIDPSGRIVMAGVAGFSATNTFAALARMLPDGTLDPAFGTNGKRTHAFTPGQLNRFNAIARRPDGKFIAVGESGNPAAENGTGALFSRLTVNGSLDPTFQNSIGFTIYNVNQGDPFNRNEAATAITILSDGKMLMSGWAQTGSVSQRNIVFIYKIAPLDFVNVDPSFGTGGSLKIGGGFSLDPGDMLVQSDGKIVLTATVRPSAGTADAQVIRLLPDGTLDSSSFGTIGRTTIDYVFPGELDLGIRAASQNGRLIIAGHSLRALPENFDLTVARLANDLIFADGIE